MESTSQGCCENSVCIYRYMHSLTHQHTVAPPEQSGMLGAQPAVSALAHMPSALGSAKTTLVWSPPASPPSLCSQSAHLFFCHFDTIPDLVPSDISALCSKFPLPSCQWGSRQRSYLRKQRSSCICVRLSVGVC